MFKDYIGLNLKQLILNDVASCRAHI